MMDGEKAKVEVSSDGEEDTSAERGRADGVVVSRRVAGPDLVHPSQEGHSAINYREQR